MKKKGLAEKIDFNIGGQAVFEGVMFRGRDKWSIAVRQPEGEIVNETFNLKGVLTNSKYRRIPVLRGIITLYETIVLGFKAIQYSANKAFGEEVELTRRDFAFTTIFAIIFAIGLFVLLPLLSAKFAVGPQDASNSFVFSLVEGFARLAVFVAYIFAISFMPDIRRVFEYHGAEHKVIHAFENGEPLNAKAAKDFSPLHVSCGTSFIVLVLLIMIILHTFIRGEFLTAFLIRLSLVPLIAGLSYEIIRLARKFDGHPIVTAVSFPGLAVQKLTTREPDESQLEVAINGLKALLIAEGELEAEPERKSVEGEEID